jgi:hypothetical protein
MPASEISQGPGEPLELGVEELDPEGIARVIYVAPLVVAVERGAHQRGGVDG